MSKALSDFYDYVMPELPGITAPLVDQHLLAVAREICERTGLWRESVSLVAEEDRLDYGLYAPTARTEVTRVLRVSWGQVLQWCATEDPQNPEDHPRFTADEPPFILDAAGETVIFEVQPHGDIDILAALRPSLAAITLPNILLTHHIEMVKRGVHSRLMRMGGKPWTDRDLAVDYGHDYDAFLNHAAMTADNGNTRALLRSRRMKL
ncbi:MAG: hypothetical protein JWQ03_587 [Variovorax sp.]|nr:hypothetical protein [Variovorax sp.]